MAKNSAGASVLSRHLRVLDSFDADAPFLGLSEISVRADLPLSTTHRLIDELCREGLVERQPDGTFRLGVRLWELACRTPGALGLREIARPYLQALHREVRQHVQLGVLNGDDVLFLDRLSARDAVVNATVIGGRIPLHASSSGQVLLAHCSSESIEALLRRPLARFTGATVTDAAELRETLRHVKAQGWAVCDGLVYSESRGIAVPVVNGDGDVVASVGVVVPSDTNSPQPHIELLLRTAAGISAAIRSAYLPVGHPASAPGGRFRPLVNSSISSMDYLATHRSARPR